MSQASNCIAPNPDIAGIGVRLSVYIQAILAFLPAAVYLEDGKIEKKELESLQDVTVVTLVTSCALLISGFIQASAGMSVYHALIVLNLCWINNTIAVTYFLFRHSEFSWRDLGKRSPQSQFPKFSKTMALASFHLCFMAAFGLWVWGSIKTFGNEAQCTPYTVYPLFGGDVHVTRLQIPALIIYCLTAIPVVNVTLFTAFTSSLYDLFGLLLGPRLISSRYRRQLEASSAHQGPPQENLGGEDKKSGSRGGSGGAQPDPGPHSAKERRISLRLKLAFPIFICLVFLAFTEQLVTRNANIVQPGEGDWTFGQTLAMVLIILPLIDVIKQIRNTRKGEEEKNKDMVKAILMDLFSWDVIEVGKWLKRILEVRISGSDGKEKAGGTA